MNIHKNARLLPFQRQAIWDAYTKDKRTVVSLAEEYKVSRPTIYKVCTGTDQGTHYTSRAFADTIARCNMTHSMSRKGNCWDNTPTERFFRS